MDKKKTTQLKVNITHKGIKRIGEGQLEKLKRHSKNNKLTTSFKNNLFKVVVNVLCTTNLDNCDTPGT